MPVEKESSPENFFSLISFPSLSYFVNDQHTKGCGRRGT